MIRGTVRDASGRPLAGARVAIAQAPVPVPEIAALTGDDGGFAFAAPAPGRYRIACVVDGQPAREVEVDVAAGDAVVDVAI